MHGLPCAPTCILHCLQLFTYTSCYFVHIGTLQFTDDILYILSDECGNGSVPNLAPKTQNDFSPKNVTFKNHIPFLVTFKNRFFLHTCATCPWLWKILGQYIKLWKSYGVLNLVPKIKHFTPPEFFCLHHCSIVKYSVLCITSISSSFITIFC